MREKRLERIDRFRIFAAALVVAIHTSPFGTYSAEADFFLTRVLGRIAVPFFFMITGHFVVSRFPAAGIGRAFRYVKKIALLYSAAIFLYLPIGIYAGQYHGLNVLDILRLLLFDGTFYHLWYFPACMVGVLLVYGLCVLFCKGRDTSLGGQTASGLIPLFAAAVVLYGIGLFGDSYYGLAVQVPAVAWFYKMMFQVFSYTRNGIFMAPVFLLLGAIMAKKPDVKPRAGFLWAGLTASFLAMTAEAFWLRSLKLQRHDSMYVFLIPVMYFLYELLLAETGNRSKRKWAYVASISTWIYIIHPAVIVAVRMGAKITKMQILTQDSLVHYLAVLVCSFGIATAFVLGINRLAAVWEKIRAADTNRKPHRANWGKDTRKEKNMGCLDIEQIEQKKQTEQLKQKEWNYVSEKPTTVNTADSGGRHAAVTGYANATGNEAAFFSDNPVLLQEDEQNIPKDQRCASARAWVELDSGALRNNVDLLRSILPPYCKLMPALKADAYGHGALQIAEALQEMGVDAFCVACVQEGVLLRRCGIRGEILVLGYTHPQEFALLLQHNLTQTVVDYAYALQLNSYGADFPVHIGIDTGMHRLGERSENLERVAAMFQMEHLRIDGIFTHLCASDTLDPCSRAYTDAQVQAFCTLLRGLEEKGIACPKVHMQASYGVLHYPHLAGDYARVGIALYGVLSTKEDTVCFQEKLRPVLSLKARVAAVKILHAGESAGYGMQFQAEEEMRIAVLTIGYADGLPRALSGGVGSVLIHGQKARVVGRICMDQTLVDVSGIPDVRAGDTAVCIGRDGAQEISAADLAQQAGTITNEILSRLGVRLKRVMV